MKKELLVEINRTREIMGLQNLVTEQEKQTKDKQTEELYGELVMVFKTTPKDEREKIKITILKGLKQSGADKETINAASKKMDELMGVEEVKVEKDGGDEEAEELGEQLSSELAYSRSGLNYKISHRRGKCYKHYHPVGAAGCLVKKILRFGTGIEIWDSNKGVDWWITTRKSRTGEESSLSSMEEYSTDMPREDWDKFYEKNNKKILRKIKNKGGKQIWEAHWELEDGKYKQFMITALEEFLRLKKKRGKIYVTVGDKPHEEIKKGKKGDKIVYPVVPLQFPVTTEPNAQYFVDNCYKVTPLFVEQIDLLMAEIVKAGEGYQPAEGKPKFWLKFCEIASSCSAVPNGKTCGETTLATAMTFPELAESRANAGKDYIIEKLKEIGCAFGKYDKGKETEWSMNTTGDGTLPGTSGPDWNPGYGKYIKPWKESGQQTIVSAENAKELKRNEVDVTGINTIFKKYEKAKAMAMGLQIIVNTQTKGEDEYEPDEPDEIIATDRLIVKMKVPGRKSGGFPIRWTWPAIRWRPFQGIARLAKGAARCLGFD